MWSLGILMYILLSGYIPFSGKSIDQVFANIKLKDPRYDMKEWTRITEEAKDLVAKCLHKNPKRRITPIDALDHPWF